MVGDGEPWLVGGVPSERAWGAFEKAYESGVRIGTPGDIIAMWRARNNEKSQVEIVIGRLAEILKTAG